jgi:hypothetical protein
MAAREIQNNINSVNISYNGNEKAFNYFLESVIKNYVFNNDIMVSFEKNSHLDFGKEL